MLRQLSLFDFADYIEKVSEKSSDTSSITNSVSEAKMTALKRFLTRRAKDAQCSVNQYRSGGSDNKIYWRVSWRDGNRIKHIHISGGNIYSKLANYRARKLQEMIDRGAELREVIAAVQTYRG